MPDEDCSILECGCDQGVFTNIVVGAAEVRDYLADETAANSSLKTWLGQASRSRTGNFWS
jgi:hypothetical protein